MTADEIRDIQEKMCDHYCRFLNGELTCDDLLAVVCRTCPMNKLTEDSADEG